MAFNMNMFKIIDINSTISKINSQDIIILDIRDKKSFLDGHIKGAINLLNENINNFINKTEKNKSIIVYCYHGNSSQNAAKFLAKCGFSDVYSLKGGYEEWELKINRR